MTNQERWARNDRLLGALVRRAPFEGTTKRLESAGWNPLVVETRRGAARQLWLRSRGLSWTKRSKHQDGRAMDIISADHPWPRTPLAFMVELAFSAREEGLQTGIFWGVHEYDRTYMERVLMHGTRQELIRAITNGGHGLDPCHCEEKGYKCEFS